MRAGVSVSWYTWLEQGRNIKVSDEVVGAISDALNLSCVDRAHLFLLAGLNPPPAMLEVSPEDVASLDQIVDQWSPLPAYAVDRYWNDLASNLAARKVFGFLGERRNYLTSFFTERAARACYPDWDDVAVRLVGKFRIQSARFPDDPAFDLMRASLCEASPEFAEIWAWHATCDSTSDRVELRLPDGGLAEFERLTLGLYGRYDIRLVVHLPGRGPA